MSKKNRNHLTKTDLLGILYKKDSDEVFDLISPYKFQINNIKQSDDMEFIRIGTLKELPGSSTFSNAEASIGGFKIKVKTLDTNYGARIWEDVVDFRVVVPEGADPVLEGISSALNEVSFERRRGRLWSFRGTIRYLHKVEREGKTFQNLYLFGNICHPAYSYIKIVMWGRIASSKYTSLRVFNIKHVTEFSRR